MEGKLGKIIRKHLPIKQLSIKKGKKKRKSYWTICDVEDIAYLIKHTIAQPDICEPHRDEPHRKLYLRKYFQQQVGVHGKKGISCKSVTVILMKIDQSLVTAFPTL